MILPDLDKRVAYYQDVMRPDDPDKGNGIADWTITSEYRPDLVVPGVGASWGCTCSPGALPEIEALTPDDVAAKRAHLIFRTPKSASEISEVERTLVHELGHVLVAPMQSTNVAAEENAMHSLDALFARLSPEHRQIFARAMQNPKARAYRAGDGEMPDPADSDKDKDKDKSEPAKALEGGASSAGDPDGPAVADILAKQDGNAALAWLAKLAGKAVDAALPGGEAAAPPAAPEPASMGMSQEDAYARARAEVTKEAVEGLIEANPHLSDKAKAVVRKQPDVARAREIIATYERPATEPAKPPMIGMPGHPATAAGGATAVSVRARALQADPEVMARVRRSTSDEDTAGLHLDIPGHILAWSPTEMLKEQFGAFKRAQKGAAQ